MKTSDKNADQINTETLRKITITIETEYCPIQKGKKEKEKEKNTCIDYTLTIQECERLGTLQCYSVVHKAYLVRGKKG